MTVPTGWPVPSQDEVEFATNVALDALSDTSDHPASARLAHYYDPHRRWAGTTFTEMQPTEPENITAADLHALTMLNASIGPLPTRRLLDDGGHRTAVIEGLMRVPLGHELQYADSGLLAAMDGLWDAVWHACSDPWSANPNPWVTAAKLCARKRPDLFPVRDRIVCEGLGLYGTTERRRGDRRVDWQVFGHLLRNHDIVSALDTLVQQDRAVRCDQSDLRVLDVVLWTWLRDPNSR